MKEKINKETGEITTLSKEDFNKVIYKETRRPDGSLRIQQDFTNCPTMTEQHTAHLTDINYLIKTYKPDEIAMYLATRAAHRKEILGHDFAQEPNLQEAKNAVYAAKQMFENLDEDIQRKFKTPMEFVKFIDNPENAKKFQEMGILTKKQIQQITIPETSTVPLTPTPTT